MDKFIQMDVFFFIASIGTIILSTLLLVIVYYAVKILRTVNKIVEETKKLADILLEEGGKTAELIREKTEEIVNEEGLPQKVFSTVLMTVINQIVNRKVKKKIK